MYMAAPIRPLFDLSPWRKICQGSAKKSDALIFMIACARLALDGSYRCGCSVCVHMCVCVCVCIGNQESHLPQQIFPGDRWSQCTVITNMICACTELCCTWLICCATCLRVGLICAFLLYYNASDGGRGEPGSECTDAGRDDGFL